MKSLYMKGGMEEETIFEGGDQQDNLEVKEEEES